MLLARLCRSALVAIVTASALITMISAPAHAASTQGVLTSICIEAHSKFMTTAVRAQCRSDRGRFLKLAKRPITLCVRGRGRVQRVSGAAVGTTKCARGDTPQVVNGERMRILCAAGSGRLHFPGSGQACARGEARRILRAGFADLVLTTMSAAPNVVVGNATTITYTLRNTGPVAATNVRVHLQWTKQVTLDAQTPGRGTSVAGSTWSVRRILPGARVTLRLTVRGSSVGLASLRADVGSMSQRDASHARAIAKISVVEPRLALSATSLDFDPLVQRNASAPRTLTVRNAGTSPTGAIAITRTGASVFTVGADQCSGAVLAPGAICTVGVTFEPTDVAASAGTLTASAVGTNTVSAKLTGTGLRSTLTVTPLTATELTMPIGSTAIVQFLLTNTGDTSTSEIGVTTTGDGFAVGFGTCAGTVLAPQQSCTLGADLTSTELGLHPGSITARAGLMNVTGDMSMTGIPFVPAAMYSVSPGTVNFAPTAAGVAAPSEVVTITNIGMVDAVNLTPSITGAVAAEFAISSNTCVSVLMPGASCTLTLEHTAAFAGPRTVDLTVQSDNGNTVLVTVNATGL